MKNTLIKYYRSVLNQIIEKLESQDYEIKLKWVSGDAREFGYRRDSHEYAEKCKYKLLEARMQLGNYLGEQEDSSDPYRQATLDRISGKDNYIPDPVDTESHFNFPEFHSQLECTDYVREFLKAMCEEIKDNFDYRESIYLNDAVNKISLGRNYLGKVLYCIKQVKENE